MTTKDDISDEERQLFRAAVSNVKPLKENQIEKIHPATSPIEKAEKPEKIAKKIKIQPKSFSDLEKTTFHLSTSQPEITGDDIISYARPGVQRKRLVQLRQGKSSIEATLDLHEKTSDEAILAIDDFLKRCHRKNYHHVCIIHGKGRFSAGNKPVLKNLLNHYLREHPLVVAFHSAKNKHGGTGALYVRIKSN